jgi:DNA-binding response OmpR family regulator
LVGIVCQDEDLNARVSDVISPTGSRETRYRADVTVEAILQDRTDLVILDGAMPQSWVLLAALHTAATVVPIIMITCAPDDHERAIAAGAAAAVPCDLTAGQLYSVITGLLRLDESMVSNKTRS